jgi:predicted Rossmann fold nucleotide-binding protein DprA/Smf involved in DNA uptake
MEELGTMTIIERLRGCARVGILGGPELLREAADRIEDLERVVADYERLADGQAPPTNGTGTSNRAADSLSPVVLSHKRRQVVAAVATHGPITSEQLAAVLGWNGNTVRPRLIECRRAGWIGDSGVRMTTASGRDAVGWAVTAAGREAIR